MCVFNSYCFVCLCLFALYQSASGDVKRDKTANIAGRQTTVEPGGSRDQHVKNVIHDGKHGDEMGVSNQVNTTTDKGITFVQLIFQQFGNEETLKVKDLQKLFEDLKWGVEFRHDFHSDHTDCHGVEQTNEHNHDNHEHNHGHDIHDHDSHDHDNHTENHTNLSHDHSEHDQSEHDHENEDTHFHDNHVHKEIKTLNETEHKADESEPMGNNRHKRTIDHHDNGCLDFDKLIAIYNLHSEQSLTPEQFLHLSPAIIYQLNDVKCKAVHFHSDLDEESKFEGVTAKVWGYSTLAVIIISLVGLLGVAVIPIMQKVFYNHLLQFLVALAVGALTGDALLHLLPHAIIGGHNHNNFNSEPESHAAHGDFHAAHGDSHVNHNLHKTAVYKGLCGLLGLFFFFVMERVLTIFTKIQRKRKQHKRRSLSPKEIAECKEDGNHIAKKLSAYDESDYQSCEEMIMVVHPNKSLKGYADETHDKVFHTNHDACQGKETRHSHVNPHGASTEEEGMLRMPHSHSGHSHHAHCDMLTNSVASVAWMVILGDGIHNFSDGLAIGAAFANSITGGISTAVAVFCHELPHEIGDFAVLLRAGMSVKQAIVYNILSSIMCFIGMLIGVAIGNIAEASSWIFAVVAGMFIYIATVDMLPEMTSVDTKQGEHPFCHLLLQCCGMILGAGIMMIIAVFEEDLLTALDGHNL